MPEHDWSAFACPNPDCPAYGQRGQGNLRPHGWSSKARNIRCLRCTTCGHSFSERAGTPLYRTQRRSIRGQGRSSTRVMPSVTSGTYSPGPATARPPFAIALLTSS
jgi:hypothetical protein